MIKPDPTLAKALVTMSSFNNQVHLNEQDQLHTLKLKSDRLFYVEALGWYFYCREGNKGPFQSKHLATQALNNYIKLQTR